MTNIADYSYMVKLTKLYKNQKVDDKSVKSLEFKDEMKNSVDPNEVAHINELPHQDLRCL